MSGTNHHANFNREFERRFKKYKGKYDFGDFAYDLYREKLTLLKRISTERAEHDRIEYGL